FKGGAWVNASDISNHFIYEENINAAYITASKESKKWDLQAGLRMENTKLIRNQVLTNNNPLQTGYINFFPNAAITYHIKAKNDIGFSYSRRIERPDYQALNPATYFFDSLTYTQGNSNLQWALSNNFEINYTHKNITATVNYSSTIDAIANVQGRDAAKKIAYIIYKNLDRASNIGIAISVPVTIQSWWQSYFYAHLYNTYCKGVVAADVFDLSTTSILLKLNSTFTLNSTLTADIRGEYKSRRLNVALLEIGEPNYTIRAGITKMLFNKRVSLTLKAQTSTYEVKSSMQYGSIDAYFIQQFDVPRVGINFIYRFGKATVAKPTERSSSASDEERSRAGG
ncbi:MAG TPA: outer membrane beta-barrel family protein, partial [Chitinophagaceae bacterium]|nr:outer membrane beta-barrel family protein [Chitinophagaceae bacterium]